jgi:hypothetical protein
MAQIKWNWTERQVSEILGPPDSTFTEDGEINWLYGTSNKDAFPTLGSVTFRARYGTRVTGGTGEPPSPTVIGEQELVDSLRWLNSDSPTVSEFDALRLIRTANFLIRKGQTKALAILSEDVRVDPNEGNRWMFWLVRIAFRSKLPGGVFPYPAIGAINPPPPKDLKEWPTYPVLLKDDIPVCCLWGLMLSGMAEPFSMYFHRCETDLVLRTRSIVPPDDPFKSYQGIEDSNLTNLKLDRHGFWPTSPAELGHGFKNSALDAILTLVKTVYKPTQTWLGNFPSGFDYETCHREFLALHAHWDPKAQAYVQK